MPKLIDLEKIKPIDFPSTEMDGLDVVRYLNTLPTVYAVPVDEIWVDFISICLENQEAILNVSICGKPNEVKLPFSKDVAEVVHGRWEWLGPNRLVPECMCGTCSVCKIRSKYIVNTDICPNCGANMDGVSDG